VVVFSFNGIDYVSHDDRLRVLAEVRRVLGPGGAFVFSSHNRDWVRFHLLPWQGRPRPGRALLRASVAALRATPARRRLRRQELVTPTYAIVNDDAHGYRLLTYYISSDDQLHQLAEAGFRDAISHDPSGAPGAAGTRSAWVYYLARA
jgi:SAM-dependent methyltransferase